jgi:hypothetical protein
MNNSHDILTDISLIAYITGKDQASFSLHLLSVRLCANPTIVWSCQSVCQVNSYNPHQIFKTCHKPTTYKNSKYKFRLRPPIRARDLKEHIHFYFYLSLSAYKKLKKFREKLYIHEHEKRVLSSAYFLLWTLSLTILKLASRFPQCLRTLQECLFQSCY